MRKLLLLGLLLTFAACSRDTVETNNPGGDPSRPMRESAPVTDATTAPPATPTASSTTGTTVTDTSSTTTTTTMPQP